VNQPNNEGQQPSAEAGREATRSARIRTPRVGTSTSRFALTAHIWNDRQRDAELIELYAQSELSLGSSNVQRHYDI